MENGPGAICPDAPASASSTTLIGDVFIGHPQRIGVRYVIRRRIRALTPVDMAAAGSRPCSSSAARDPDTEIAASEGADP